MAAIEKLILTQAHVDFIAADALAQTPKEACGLLLGKRTEGAARVSAVQKMKNVAPEPENRFEIAPQALFDAHRLARRQGLDVIGHYHSHPNGMSQPSAWDRAAISDIHAIWIIQAVKNGAALPLMAFAVGPETTTFNSLVVEVRSR